PDVAFLDEVDELQPAVYVALRNRNDEPKVRLHELGARGRGRSGRARYGESRLPDSLRIQGGRAVACLPGGVNERTGDGVHRTLVQPHGDQRGEDLFVALTRSQRGRARSCAPSLAASVVGRPERSEGGSPAEAGDFCSVAPPTTRGGGTWV